MGPSGRRVRLKKVGGDLDVGMLRELEVYVHRNVVAGSVSPVVAAIADRLAARESSSRSAISEKLYGMLAGLDHYH